MRTRSQSKRPQSVETLSNSSRDAVGKLLKRVNKGFNKENVGYLRQCESAATMERGSRDSDKRSTGTAIEKGTAEPECYGREAMQYASNPEKDEDDKDYDDSEWEDGSIPTLSSMKDFQEDLASGISVEFDVSHCLPKRKPVRRATAEEKEVAEFVHKAHLLCLLGRGRLIDCACNDPLIQASLLSLVPTHLLKIAEASKLTASRLVPLVSWFHNNFHVRSQSVAEKSCHSALASTLETREGTPEAVAALSVALFRALNLTTRFVSILDVVSLKPDGELSEPIVEVGSKRGRDIFSSSTLMVAGPSCSFASSVKSPPEVEHGISQTAAGGAGRQADKSKKNGLQCQDSLTIDEPKDKMSDVAVPEPPIDISEPCLVKSDGLKRKGDLEFQMQLEMALSATAIGSSKISMASSASESPSTSSILTPPSKRMRKIKKEESQTSSDGISTAIGSKKVGAPLYWAEVFCCGENLTGKWVHVDAINGIVDGEHKVEAAAVACKKSLRYVVAFAGQGAKDVTRRYCTKWYKVAAKRVNSSWWDAVLAPLRELESGATWGGVNLEYEASAHEKNEESQVANSNHGCSLDKNHSCGSCKECSEKQVEGSSMRKSFASTRSSLEDMELETRALTEPLPTNQQAYRNHQLYVIERWLNKNQVLYPKGPVLGFCSGHAVYPRTCVQTLRPKERWLREGLQVKAGEVPAKVLKRSLKRGKEEAPDDDNYADGVHQEITALYGRWQTEPLHLPRAVNGIVPKNERGRVDVWSEKCLPPGTVHLRLPRVAAVARRLDIDYASAMVGFEFRNGRSAPLFEGIVVCTEFKDAILQAYLEEEERREAEEKRRNEVQALSRWYQLLSSIITRQRLNSCYGAGALSQPSTEIPKSDDKCSTSATRAQEIVASPRCQQDDTFEKPDIPPSMPEENHEHEFVLDKEASSEEGPTQVKRCRCGFSVQFETL
ncbi:UNVERIFIED_CONTAM: DNA repair protein [Sesamum calycinum]|uniref:DNA repair protein n=1 Tax=Sesamum calycinum TaxID=2727403 RepID=A0AAW2MMV7_9LAMI